MNNNSSGHKSESVDGQRCVECGHSEGVDKDGRCFHLRWRETGRLVQCGHKCSFPVASEAEERANNRGSQIMHPDLLTMKEVDRIERGEARDEQKVSPQAAGEGIPENIWLQWYGDSSPDDVGNVSVVDVTWEREKIFKHDIEYIRARAYSPTVNELAAVAVENIQKAWYWKDEDKQIADGLNQAAVRLRAGLVQPVVGHRSSRGGAALGNSEGDGAGSTPVGGPSVTVDEAAAERCKHNRSSDEYCFDCVRVRHNEDMLDGRFDDDEFAPLAAGEGVPERGMTREQAFELASEYERPILEIIFNNIGTIRTNRSALKAAREIAACVWCTSAVTVDEKQNSESVNQELVK